MIGSGLVGVRTRQRAALCLGLLTCIIVQAASAADCPGHPDALGTSRTLVVDPREHPRIGTMQYAETLPLADHEVVLTFDDGPLPRNSNQVLDILASQCVKATFFTIGRMAQAYPEGVRKLRDAGHSIGTHTQDHPRGMKRMPVERARQEIDEGIASVKAALGDDAALAPFFRIPGLSRADGVEDYLASQGIQIWSADFLADDWRHISSSRVYDFAMKRAEAAVQKLSATGSNEACQNAQYAIPLAFRKRTLFKMDFAEAVYISELRTTPAGHTSYRNVAYAMYEAVAAKYPALAKYFRVHDVREPVDLLKR